MFKTFPNEAMHQQTSSNKRKPQTARKKNRGEKFKKGSVYKEAIGSDPT